MSEKVRITVEFDAPGNHTLEECCKLVLLQMRASPQWPDGEEGGTGNLNYVCHGRELRIVAAEVRPCPK